MAQRMYFGVPYRAHRDQRHVERVECRVALNEDESQCSAGEDRDQCGANQDQPVAEAAHAVAILTATSRFLAHGNYRREKPATAPAKPSSGIMRSTAPSLMAT